MKNMFLLENTLLLNESIFGKSNQYTTSEKGKFMSALKTAVETFKTKNSKKGYTYLKSLSELKPEEKKGLNQIFIGSSKKDNFTDKWYISNVGGCIVIYYIRSFSDKSKKATFIKPMAILLRDAKGILRFKMLKVK